MRNALLVYPDYPPSYWGINYALELLGAKAAFPPLGLLTAAAMFPPEYDLRVVDMNVSPLEDSDLDWADMVFTSTMIVQRESLRTVIERCNHASVPVVAEGPYPTSCHKEIAGVDYFVLDEAEETFPRFLQDLDAGRAKAIYREPRKPDVTRTPIPRSDLVELQDYHAMCVQRGRRHVRHRRRAAKGSHVAAAHCSRSCRRARSSGSVGSVRAGRQLREGDGRDSRFIGQQRRIEEIVIQHYGRVQQTPGGSHRRPVRRPRRDRPVAFCSYR